MRSGEARKAAEDETEEDLIQTGSTSLLLKPLTPRPLLTPFRRKLGPFSSIPQLPNALS